MRKFSLEYKSLEFVQQVVAQIPWSHNVVLMDRISDVNKRIWYINKIIENGWSRNILINQIESKLFERQHSVEKTTNFMEKLDSPNNKLALDTLKDPYIFDIAYSENALEKDVENALVSNITNLLLEFR